MHECRNVLAIPRGLLRFDRMKDIACVRSGENESNEQQ